LGYSHKKDGGSLEFNSGNAYGCSYTCNVCLGIFILPTKEQLRVRPELLETKEFKMIEVIA